MRVDVATLTFFAAFEVSGSFSEQQRDVVECLKSL